MPYSTRLVKQFMALLLSADFGIFSISAMEEECMEDSGLPQVRKAPSTGIGYGAKHVHTKYG